MADADPDNAVELHGTVAVQGQVTGKDPDSIVAQIERTRENLAQTIDTLADRVSPANNVRRLREQAMEQAARPEVRLAAAAVGLAILGVAIIRIWGRRRR
jgi:predicted TIM-barrel fold metal-dependent hydrolase